MHNKFLAINYKNTEHKLLKLQIRHRFELAVTVILEIVIFFVSKNETINI